MAASSQDDEGPIVLPFDDTFEVQTNTSRGFSIQDVYHADFDDEPLAGGGFGTVYQGAHLFVPDMPVAVKQLHLQIRQAGSELHGEDQLAARRRLIMGVEEQVTEISILQQVRDSPHMLHLYEYFVESDASNCLKCLYIVTEFLQGGELFHCIAQRNHDGQPFSEGDVRDIFRILLRALRYMQSKRIIHRDLKPSNLLLQIQDEPSSLKVADFGQSKMLRDDEERTRTCTGTPGYRPPEMYLRQEYNELSDMFSAGVILFFLLAGYQPFSSFPKAQIELKTIRCEYRQNVESWNRVSLKAKRLVKRLLTRAEYRMSVEEAQSHEWMHEDGCSVADLTENARAIAKSMQEEQKLKQERMAYPPSITNGRLNSHDRQRSAELASSRQDSGISLPREYGQSIVAGTATSVINNTPVLLEVEDTLSEPAIVPDVIMPSSTARFDNSHDDDHTIRVVVGGNRGQQPRQSEPRRENIPQAAEATNCCSFLLDLFQSRSAESSESSESRRAVEESGRISSLGFSMDSCRVRYITPDESIRSNRVRSDSIEDAEDVDQQPNEQRGQPVAGDTSSPNGDYQASSIANSTARQGITRNHSVSFLCASSVGGQSWQSNALPAGSYPSQTGLTFWDPLVLHVGSDLPRASKPLLAHISDTYSSSEYSEVVARRYCRLIFKCIAGLHESNVVHRCITMTNLFVQRRSDGKERVILRNTPFTANAVPGDRTLTGYCGTPYRSTAPEVYSDFSYDEKVDLWSLGIVTYFLLCGIDPFHGSKDDVEVKRRCVYIEYPFSFDAPSQAARGFVELLLQPEPIDRPTAREALQHEWMLMDDVALADISLDIAYGGLTDWV